MCVCVCVYVYIRMYMKVDVRGCDLCIVCMCTQV